MTITPDKHFSQNFLVDPYILDELRRFIAPQRSDYFVEIGPGKGALTERIAPEVHQLYAVEIDQRLIAYLNERQLPHTKLIAGDILEQNWATLLCPQTETQEKIRLIGNLPYHLTSDILQLCVTHAHLVSDIHFMVQKEVAERLMAQSGKNYGRLSLLVQLYFDIRLLCTLSPRHFYPTPKVYSSFIRLKPHPTPPLCQEKTLRMISRLAFQKRRKQIGNSLSSLFTMEELLSLKLSPLARPDILRPHEFYQLCAYYERRHSLDEPKA